ALYPHSAARPNSWDARNRPDTPAAPGVHERRARWAPPPPAHAFDRAGPRTGERIQPLLLVPLRAEPQRVDNLGSWRDLETEQFICGRRVHPLIIEGKGKQRFIAADYL